MPVLIRTGAVVAFLAILLIAGLSRFADAQCGMMGGSRSGMHGMMENGRTEPPAAGDAGSPSGTTPSAISPPPSEIVSGSQAFDQVCGTCHAFPSPAVHTADQWPQVVERMRAHLAASGGSLDQTTALEIDEYLESEAQR
jgi:cytochrome c5